MQAENWTGDEIRTLKKLYRKTPLPELSKMLRRTVGAIKKKAARLGLRKR